jgi:hypothetical protein
MQAISDLLGLPPKDLEDSFSGVLPYSAADLIRSLAEVNGQTLIASCFAGRVRPRLAEEEEDAFRHALNRGVCVAMFFPFTSKSGSTARRSYSEPLTNHHKETWRTVVRFWKMLRSLIGDSKLGNVRLYRPSVDAGNVLFPPIFHRPALLCERVSGRATKVALYTWIQAEANDGFYPIGGRSLETPDTQAEAWELFFGDVYRKWDEGGTLSDGDHYWRE